MEKPKMWNISKTAERRAKRTKIWDLGVFESRFLEFSLASFSALCKISDSIIFKTLLLQLFSSDPIQTL